MKKFSYCMIYLSSRILDKEDLKLKYYIKHINFDVSQENQRVLKSFNNKNDTYKKRHNIYELLK